MVKENDESWIKTKLKRSSVDFVIYRISDNKSNIFFGDSNCVKIIRRIGKRMLNEYTPEEDFILGTMLGYCRRKQCDRYLNICEKADEKIEELIG